MATIDSNKTYPKEKNDLSAVKRKRDESLAKIAKLHAKTAAVEDEVRQLDKEIFAREDGRTLAAIKILLEKGNVPGLTEAMDHEKEKLEIGSVTKRGRPARLVAAPNRAVAAPNRALGIKAAQAAVDALEAAAAVQVYKKGR